MRARHLSLLVVPFLVVACAERSEEAPAAADGQPAKAPAAQAEVSDDRSGVAATTSPAEPTPGPAASAATGTVSPEGKRPMASVPRAPGAAPPPRLDLSPSDKPKDQRGKMGGVLLPDGGGKGEAGRRIEGVEKSEGRIAEMHFQHYGVNPTVETDEERLSTFGIDVDTTAYTMTRGFLERGQLPDEAAVRVEEIVNSFDYGYTAPQEGVFSIQAEAAPSPNRQGYHTLHIGLKGKEIKASARKQANLVFVIDISGSMDAENRLGLVKKSLHLLVAELEEGDTVGIVAYGSTARDELQPTSAHNKDRILAAIDGLRTEGATNAEAGIRSGYAMAARAQRQGGNSRVILCSDGVANTGMTTAAGILDAVSKHSRAGITITTVGFGMGSYNDVLMEQLADKGNGNYHYVDRLEQARRVFVENLTGTLEVIAKDVKIQVEFDPAAVARYRLLGYENRQLAARDFDDDRVDAGEVGAGHSVTAVYEVKLKDAAMSGGRALGKVHIRFKAPEGQASQQIDKSLPASIVKKKLEEVSSPTQLSFVSAGFAEKLRGSYWARNLSYEDLLGRFNMMAPGLRQRADVAELKRLIEKARDLDKRPDKFEAEMPVAMMDFDRVPVLR